MTERGFVLIGHWVRIKVGYGAGWIGQVMTPPNATGHVMVRWTASERATACYTLKEIEPIEASSDEETMLVARITALAWAEPILAGAGRRIIRLTHRLRALQRARGAWKSTAIILYTGGAA